MGRLGPGPWFMRNPTEGSGRPPLPDVGAEAGGQQALKVSGEHAEHVLEASCKRATGRVWVRGTALSLATASLYAWLFPASAIIGIIFIKEKWKPKDFVSKSLMEPLPSTSSTPSTPTPPHHGEMP